jgi:hypothetical protein
MTTSVVGAAMFSALVFVIPTSTGRPARFDLGIPQPPAADIENHSNQSSSDSSSSTLVHDDKDETQDETLEALLKISRISPECSPTQSESVWPECSPTQSERVWQDRQPDSPSP